MTELPTRQGTITTPPHSEPIVLSGAREEHACCRTVRITKDAVPAYAGGITTVTSQGFHYVALPHTPKKNRRCLSPMSLSTSRASDFTSLRKHASKPFVTQIRIDLAWVCKNVRYIDVMYIYIYIWTVWFLLVLPFKGFHCMALSKFLDAMVTCVLQLCTAKCK